MRILTNEEVSFVLHKAIQEYKESSELRIGQCFFNNLAYYHEDVSDSIRSSKWDTYYHDDRIVKCINFITGHNE